MSVPGGALRRVRLPWALLLAAVAAPACIKAPVRADLPTAAPSAASAPAASASATPQTQSEIVIGRFKADGLAVRTVTYFLPGHDPNPPLGTAGVYAGGTWYDGTLQPPAEDTVLGFEDGGSVEVFGSQADRESRQRAFASLPVNAGTVIGRGPFLLLLSPLLAPAVVTRYQQALESVAAS